MKYKKTIHRETNMVLRKRLAKNKLKTAATYGAAMSLLFVANEIQAEVLDITWNDGHSQIQLNFNGSQLMDIDQISGDSINDLYAFNNYFTLTSTSGFFYAGARVLNPIGSITQFERVGLGDVIDPNTFEGTPWVSHYAPGYRYIGFSTANGNAGWFKLDLTNFPKYQPTLSYGEYGSNGESLTVGGTKPVLRGDVNNDGQVNLLDVAPFVDRITTGTFQSEADVNQDGAVNLLDVAPFVSLLSG